MNIKKRSSDEINYDKFILFSFDISFENFRKKSKLVNSNNISQQARFTTVRA